MGYQDCWWCQARRRRRASRLARVPICQSGTKAINGWINGQLTEHRIQAQDKARPDASAIYVPGNQTAQAIEEAIEAEIPLVVAVAEHVPIHDILRVWPGL